MTLFQSLFVILTLISIGLICEKRKILNHHQIEGVELFLFKIAMPCYLFSSTLRHDLTKLFQSGFIFSYLFAFLIVAVLISVFSYKKSTLSELYIKILASGYVNTAIYALPVITFLLGDPTAGILGNLVQIIIIQTIIMTILSFVNHKEKSLSKKLMTIVTTPLIMMPILGLFCNYTQLLPHPVIIESIQSLGNGASGLALFIFGLTIGGIQISRENLTKNLLLAVGTKNILHPTVAFFIGKYVFYLESYWLSALVISASAPTAFIVYLIAKQFSTEQDFAKRAVALSSILSLISLVVIASFLA